MSYLDAIRASVPQHLLEAIGLPAREQQQASAIPASAVDLLLQLAAGASCPSNLQTKHETLWKEGQERFLSRVGAVGLGKRARTTDEEAAGTETNGGPSTTNKKPKASGLDATQEQERGEPRYTLHAISVSAPVRKKADVTITSTSLLLCLPSNSSSDTNKPDLAHPPIPLSSLKRAFLVPNLGKNRNKPHWTVVLTVADVVSKNDTATQMQVVFAVDRAPSVKELFAVTDHTKSASPSRSSQPKGTETLPFLETFLSFLPPSVTRVIVSEATQPQVFKSSFNQPYLDTYRAAKEGSLYFLPEGILWAEARPVEFFALADLAPDSDDPSLGGVRTLSATGRTFSLYVRRWIREGVEKDKNCGEEEEEEGILVDEVEFSMIDGREQENVMQWVRRYKRKFGQKEEVDGQKAVGEPYEAKTKANGALGKGKGKAPMTIDALDDDTDEEDEDFVASSSDESSSSDSEGSEGGGEGAGGEAEAADTDEEVEGDGDGDGDVEMEDEMSAERHPLLRPGAMPRMSKAAMDMAVAMVTQDFAGGGEEDGEDEEGDELDE